jgi:hypothetical protein
MILSAMITIFYSVVLSVIQGISVTQLCYLYRNVGRYKIVSEHSVACTIENLGMDNHRTKVLFKVVYENFLLSMFLTYLVHFISYL